MPREQVHEVMRKVQEMGLTVVEIGSDLWQVDIEDCTILLAYKPHDDVLELLLPFSTVPEGAGEAFYRFLLEMNFDRVLYGAFALKDKEVVLVDRLNCVDLHEKEVVGSVKALKDAMLRAIHDLKSETKGGSGEVNAVYR